MGELTGIGKSNEEREISKNSFSMEKLLTIVQHEGDAYRTPIFSEDTKNVMKTIKTSETTNIPMITIQSDLSPTRTDADSTYSLADIQPQGILYDLNNMVKNPTKMAVELVKNPTKAVETLRSRAESMWRKTSPNMDLPSAPSEDITSRISIQSSNHSLAEPDPEPALVIRRIWRSTPNLVSKAPALKRSASFHGKATSVQQENFDIPCAELSSTYEKLLQRFREPLVDHVGPLLAQVKDKIHHVDQESQAVSDLTLTITQQLKVIDSGQRANQSYLSEITADSNRLLYDLESMNDQFKDLNAALAQLDQRLMKIQF